jgi:hypothetical protein
VAAWKAEGTECFKVEVLPCTLPARAQERALVACKVIRLYHFTIRVTNNQ